MAEQWTVAFGRYLKMLRERRGLSLDDVASLSQTFADTIQKAWLSKCEHGQHRLAFSKAIPLCRIYHVPADVLVERLELDMELDRVGSPATEGLTFAELRSAGAHATAHKQSWDAYAYLRDAMVRASTDPVDARYTDREEQLAMAVVNCGSGARALSRYRYALHEFLHVEGVGRLSPQSRVTLLHRLASVNRNLGRLDESRGYSNRALEEAETCGLRDYLAFVYEGRGLQELNAGNPELAIPFFQKAYRVNRQAGELIGCTTLLNNIALAYFNQRRFRAAQRTLTANRKLTRELCQKDGMARCEILLGRVDDVHHNYDEAVRHWKIAGKLAKEIHNNELRFLAEFHLLKEAKRRMDAPVERAIHRRLTILANYIPASTPELAEFLALQE